MRLKYEVEIEGYDSINLENRHHLPHKIEMAISQVIDDLGDEGLVMVSVNLNEVKLNGD